MMLDTLVKCLEKSTADHVEMRHHRRQTLSISIRDGKMDELNKGFVEGVCCRAMVKGSWGFSSTTSLEEKDMVKALKDATSLARASKPKKRRLAKLAEVKPAEDNYTTKVKRDPRKANQEELVSLVKDTDADVRGFSKRIVSDSVVFMVIDDDLAFASSEGARITQRIVRFHDN